MSVKRMSDRVLKFSCIINFIVLTTYFVYATIFLDKEFGRLPYWILVPVILALCLIPIYVVNNLSIMSLSIGGPAQKATSIDKCIFITLSHSLNIFLCYVSVLAITELFQN